MGYLLFYSLVLSVIIAGTGKSRFSLPLVLQQPALPWGMIRLTRSLVSALYHSFKMASPTASPRLHL